MTGGHQKIEQYIPSKTAFISTTHARTLFTREKNPRFFVPSLVIMWILFPRSSQTRKKKNKEIIRDLFLRLDCELQRQEHCVQQQQRPEGGSFTLRMMFFIFANEQMWRASSKKKRTKIHLDPRRLAAFGLLLARVPLSVAGAGISEGKKGAKRESSQNKMDSMSEWLSQSKTHILCREGKNAL